MTDTALAALAGFIRTIAWSSLAPNRRETARGRLLDSIACSLASRRSPITDRALTAAMGGASGPATLWLAGRGGPVADAAFHNSVLAHAILHEDVGQGGHPGSTVVPAAVAAAEAEEASGAELLAAIVVGYEVQARMGAGNILRAVGDRGLRGTTATGAFGAAAAAARLMRLDHAQTESALALAASLCAPGIEEPLLVGSDERCLQVAANARAGVQAAELARAGFTGAASALSGRSGFFAVYGGSDGIPAAVADDLGEHWVSDGIVAKPYPTAGWNVGPIYAALSLGPYPPTDVERVDVLHTWWGRNTAYLHPGPFTTMEQALISCPFAVATALVFGRYDWEVVRRAFDDTEVAQLAGRVRVDGVATWGFTDGAVTVRLRHGDRPTATAAEIPARLVRPSWEEMLEKANALTAPVLSPERREALLDRLGRLDQDAEVALGNLLGPPWDRPDGI